MIGQALRFGEAVRDPAGGYLACVVAVVAQDAELGPDQRHPTWHSGPEAAVTLAARSGSPRRLSRVTIVAAVNAHAPVWTTSTARGC